MFLPKWYPHREDSMFGLFVKNHALTILPHHDVSVLFVHPVESQKEIFNIGIQDEEGLFTVRVYYLNPSGGFAPITLIKKAHRFRKANKLGLQKIKEARGLPDLTHVNVLTRHGVFALWIKRKFNIPYVVTEHWSRYLPKTGTYGGALRKLLTRMVVKRASAVTTVSENLRKAMESHHLYNFNYQVVYNVVDTNRFLLPKEKKQEDDKKRFLHISCFEDRSKNISGILSTLKELTKVRQDWECVFVGVGEDYELLTEYAAELGLTPEFVKFAGLQEGAALVKSIQESDFLILFSNYENMPVVIGEAFACGKPVVSTDVGGIAEIVNEDRGILLQAGDEKAFKEALNSMLDTSSDYDTNVLREYAIKNFSAPEVGERFAAIYEEVLSETNIH
jgi:glycosyltransferase involved in cell wall biosynthesis